MGSDDPDVNPGDGEGPVREVTVAPFAISAHAVTNEEFATFIDATGHRTDAERFGWTHVFAGFLPGSLRRVSPRAERAPWWCAVRGASWRHPEGPGSTLDDRADHPAVHVSWNDATAFCRWVASASPPKPNGSTPHAAAWRADATRGRRTHPGGLHMCNIWQGHFPTRNTAEDGYKTRNGPLTAFPPNGYGLHNMAGNVWEWCADSWGDGRVLRGGSYLCHASYCNRYRVAARTNNSPDSSSGNTGFRYASS